MSSYARGAADRPGGTAVFIKGSALAAPMLPDPADAVRARLERTDPRRALADTLAGGLLGERREALDAMRARDPRARFEDTVRQLHGDAQAKLARAGAETEPEQGPPRRRLTL